MLKDKVLLTSLNLSLNGMFLVNEDFDNLSQIWGKFTSLKNLKLRISKNKF